MTDLFVSIKVCALLSSAERYIHFKCTKSLVQKVLEFVDEHGTEVLNLVNPLRFYFILFDFKMISQQGSFTLLPQHVVRLILGKNNYIEIKQKVKVHLF